MFVEVGPVLDLLRISYNILDDETCKEEMKASVALYASASYILIVISVLIVIISFFGCCGAYKVTLDHHFRNKNKKN